MILKIQIALTILACLFVMAVFPVAAWTSLGWGIAVALAAALCYCGVLLCKKYTQTDDEQGKEPSNQEAEQENQTPIDSPNSDEKSVQTQTSEDSENQEK